MVVMTTSLAPVPTVCGHTFLQPVGSLSSLLVCEVVYLRYVGRKEVRIDFTGCLLFKGHALTNAFADCYIVPHHGSRHWSNMETA